MRAWILLSVQQETTADKGPRKTEHPPKGSGTGKDLDTRVLQVLSKHGYAREKTHAEMVTGSVPISESTVPMEQETAPADANALGWANMSSAQLKAEMSRLETLAKQMADSSFGEKQNSRNVSLLFAHTKEARCPRDSSF